MAEQLMVWRARTTLPTPEGYVVKRGAEFIAPASDPRTREATLVGPAGRPPTDAPLHVRQALGGTAS